MEKNTYLRELKTMSGEFELLSQTLNLEARSQSYAERLEGYLTRLLLSRSVGIFFQRNGLIFRVEICCYNSRNVRGFYDGTFSTMRRFARVIH